MTKQQMYKDDARHKLLAGVTELAKAVKVTMGSRGRIVVVGSKFGTPKATKDGVSVAKEIELECPYENLGAQMVKEVAANTAKVAGDGTTTSIVLAEAIFREGLKMVTSGANPIDLKRGIDIAVKHLVEQLDTNTTPIETHEQMQQIATISANGDTELGNIIAEAMRDVDNHGVINVEESNKFETFNKLVKGMNFNKGYMSRNFLAKSKTGKVELINPLVLVIEDEVTDASKLNEILMLAFNAKAPLLIIADNISDEIVGELVVSKLQSGFNVCAVKAPGFGDRKKDNMSDIALYTGAKYVSTELGVDLTKLTLADLGRASKIVIDKDETTIFTKAVNPLVEPKVAELNEYINSPGVTEYDIEKTRERISKLNGKVSNIYVGAGSEVELGEKKDRLEDALYATRAAVEEGIIAGGGTAIIKAGSILDTLDLGGDLQIGVDIVKSAINTPLQQIARNAGASSEVILHKVLEQGDINFGYNATTEEYGNMLDFGVIDPKKVTRCALQYAASVVGTMLMTECVIVDSPETTHII